MNNRIKMKSILVTGIMALLSVSGAATVHAGTATGTNNPELTVSVSVSPDLLRVGSTATVNESITNNTTANQTVTPLNTLVTPKGQTVTQSAGTIQVPATQTVNLTPDQYVIKQADPKGTYALTFAATDGNGTSSATTHYTITK